jgi:hypothetical protein
MQKLLQIVGVVLIGLLFVWSSKALLDCITSPEYCYAGMHTEGCDGSEKCGCYEKLLEMDRERAKSTHQE